MGKEINLGIFADNNKNIQEATLSLLSDLGIKMNVSTCVDISIPTIVKNSLGEIPQAVQDICDKIAKSYLAGVISDKTFKGEDETESVEEALKADRYEKVIVLAVDFKEDSKVTRSEMATLTRSLNRASMVCPVVLVCRYTDEGGTRFALSLCERTAYKQSGHIGEKVGKVSILRGINPTDPHRGHMDILERMECSDCTTFVELYNKWQKVFDTELLTKEFYKKLYNWYLWAIEPSTGITFPNLVTTSKDDRDDIAIKIIRLITRILFVWFIKQKKLVPNDLFNENELNSILKDFNPQSKEDGKYYNAILQNLFFATLNNEIGKRSFVSEPFKGKSSSFGVKNLFRDSQTESWFKIEHDKVLKLFHSVPFMNCGLFECLDKYAKSDIGLEEDLFLDGFSSRDSLLDGHFKYRAFIPNKLFFAEEHKEMVTVEENKELKEIEISVMGLIPLLEHYHFTVQENTPSEVEVSLDPELLGQVFENLLAAYNPETKESARKSTGSYYTPRLIVEYMVNESLIAYLKTKVPSVAEDNWRALINYDDKPFDLSENEQKATLDAIFGCKVLDPACGSGAFPMGMLQQMVHIVSKLDSKFNAYETKLRIINNCIYGSDIQPIAMLISKLRFFISLICEQEESKIKLSDDKNNYGINTLPNLETKFVAANSLLQADIHSYADEDWTQDKTLIKLKNELLAIRKSHFSERTQTAKLKKREEDRLKREEINNYILGTTTQPDSEKIQMCEARIRSLEDERKGYKGEKIVEEYVEAQASLFGEEQRQLVRKDVNKNHRDKIDKEIESLKQSIAKEQNKRNPNGFSAAIKQITDWNPYDQLKAAPFFDPDWMFGVKEGFDIVIGNPPYVSRLDKEMKILLGKQYPEAKKRIFDLYNFFMVFSTQILTRGTGVSSLIVPPTWLNNKNNSTLRRYMAKNGLCRVDFLGDKVFDAVVYSCIYFTSYSRTHIECFDTQLINGILQQDHRNTIEIQHIIDTGDYISPAQTGCILSKFRNHDKFINLGNISNIVFGIQDRKSANDPSYIRTNMINENCKRALNGKHINRYYPLVELKSLNSL